MIFLDIEKAFDKLWIKGLIAKCAAHDMPNWMILIIQDFLTERKFRVQVNHSFSDAKGIKTGVPQGSVLAPTLFNIYMADLRVNPPVKLELYADDAAIYMQHCRDHYTIRKLQQTVQDKEQWNNKWKLQIYARKTREMYISTKAMYISRTGKRPPRDTNLR
ncbi:hypothetical protein JGF61_23425, partial [Salmonella enterica subsp. enterica serovar Agona]|nr:hypothetical protein [Salmonella enterica subsp. enterica serovar Agona]